VIGVEDMAVELCLGILVFAIRPFSNARYKMNDEIFREKDLDGSVGEQDFVHGRLNTESERSK